MAYPCVWTGPSLPSSFSSTRAEPGRQPGRQRAARRHRMARCFPTVPCAGRRQADDGSLRPLSQRPAPFGAHGDL
jgi:hypothetical protein